MNYSIINVATKSFWIIKLSIKSPKSLLKNFFILSNESYFDFDEIIIRLHILKINNNENVLKR